MRFAAVAVAVAVIGCGSDPRDCSLAAVVDDYEAGAMLVDCGSLYDDGTSGIDMAAWQAASACALDHAQQQAAFTVRWTSEAIEGPLSGAYVGLQHDGAWTLSAFAQSAGITGVLPPAKRYACSALRASTMCSSVKSSLCIECVGQTVADDCMP
jgi:hypothetical protein